MKYLILLCILVFVSCKEAPNTEPVNFAEEQVELGDKAASSDWSSYKRSRLPLVDVLYLEAKDRDSRLADLDEQIQDMAEVSRDSLARFENYKKYSLDYYSSAKDYVRGIQDTARRTAIQKILAQSRVAFDLQLKAYESEDDALRQIQGRLADEHIVMKLLVSKAMIRAHQSNEPSVATFKNLEEQYQRLLTETKAYTEK